MNMGMDVTTIVGLIGVTMIVTASKIFEPTRGWLLGFAHPYNPLRLIGVGMICPMCVGWWAGFVWGIHGGHGAFDSVVTGGVVSVSAFAVDELLGIIVAIGMRVAPKRQPIISDAPAPRQPPLRPQRAPEDKPLSEAEAHSILDADDEFGDGS